jgi:hypothetical protein
MSFKMQHYVMLVIGLLFISASCGPGVNVSEADKNGKDTAWWIHAKVKSEYGTGPVNFLQTDAEGKQVNRVDVTAWSPADQVVDRSFDVRVSNKDSCATPCGYVKAWVCSNGQENCKPEEAQHNFPPQAITGWTIQF